MSAIGAKGRTSAQARGQTTTRMLAPIDFRDRSRELLRGMLLDSVCTQLLERPWEAVSMLKVARAAGVHRSSLYNEFGTRRNLIVALIAREAGRLPATLTAPLRADSQAPMLALRDTFQRFLDASRENGLLVALLRPGESELRTLASTRMTATLARFSGAVQEAWPRLAREDCEQIVEWLFRFAVSVARVPAGPATAEHVGRLLGSYVEDRLQREVVLVAPFQGAQLQA